MNIFFRADSSSTIGTGHIMRDLVLASQYKDANIIFATQDLDGNINHNILEAGYNIYEIEPKRLREQLKRNIERFPKDYAYQLTDEDMEIMGSQNATPSKVVNSGCETNFPGKKTVWRY